MKSKHTHKKRETITQTRTETHGTGPELSHKKIIMSLKTSFVYWPPQGEGMYVVFTVD